MNFYLSNSSWSGPRKRRAGFVSALVGALLFFSLTARAQDDDAHVTPIPSGPYRIAGTVVNAKTGSPLARTRVTIGDTKQRHGVQSVIAGDDGHFEFHVPSGKYSLAGEKRGFYTSSYNQHEQFSTAIVTAADLDTESLVLRLQPNAVLSGRVLDEFQEPVRNAQVMLYRENHSQGVSRIERFRGATTNDEGRYEITPLDLDLGTYFVAVKATPWYAVHPALPSDGSPPSQVDSALDVAYPVTYYGDTTETDSATPIPVRGGDHLEADVHLSPVPAVHLIVRVEQQAQGSYRLPVLQTPTFDGLEQIGSTGVRQLSEGVFELSGIAAGRYTIKMPEANGQTRESNDVDLTSGGELDGSSGSLTSKVKITVQIAGTMSVPSLLQVTLRDGKGRLNTSPVDHDGDVIFSDLTAGKYDISARWRDQGYSVTQIATGSGTIAGHTLSVPGGASLNLTVTLVGGSATVEGVAKRDGKAVAGAMIVLVPKEANADRSLFRRDQSDLDGSFTLPNVIPGAYTVIAIDDGWELNWSEPAVLAPYLARGQTVEVADHERSPKQLAEAVQVQGK